jgi:hypothetical protein
VGGHARHGIEDAFNVQKNGGFGLEHAFCANDNAAHVYHLLMQVAHALEQLLLRGLLWRLTRQCRKLSEVKHIDLLHDSLLYVPIDPDTAPCGQLRFRPSG